MKAPPVDSSAIARSEGFRICAKAAVTVCPGKIFPKLNPIEIASSAVLT